MKMHLEAENVDVLLVRGFPDQVGTDDVEVGEQEPFGLRLRNVY